MNVENEVQLLVEQMQRLGTRGVCEKPTPTALLNWLQWHANCGHRIGVRSSGRKLDGCLAQCFSTPVLKAHQQVMFSGFPSDEMAVVINKAVKRIESPVQNNGPDGKLKVKFGVLFHDDQCANLFEAMVGTLKAAKRKKILSYDSEMLLQGVHDDIDIVLLEE